MVARIIDGKRIAKEIRQEIAAQVAKLTPSLGRPPGLAAVLVGDDPASQVYVSSKRKACAEAGLSSWLHHFPADTTTTQLLEHIHQLNQEKNVDGILVQLPLPKQVDEFAVLSAVDVRKDVDGFGPVNAGLLALGKPGHVSCTPLGIWELCIRENISLSGQHVVILGRSGTVGKPLSSLLVQKHPQANATVTVCHSHSLQTKELCRIADVIIAAIGKPQFVTADMVKPGAVIIDVGINRLPDGKLVGDVDYGAVSQVASAITPVPGGVGPMTIAMLLRNTVNSAQRLQNNRQQNDITKFS
ncbi:MAG TPA: bifunctional methylenetetrahydrofolate dehydrogenase/methenyltetrahydrofolate cyclohydrolase FolD [Gemmatales bacterium]|nr:bifunctional methylenetetrahydrofolate dehydrogenase/methenyltetrahydrofolate cyclohydrolase FolD [Gemmatales bacterium]HMP17101.1 bifunctional methylenetetrahydrofolate dehydrogenase/methenyltetrahydrofolate cyclohydrolase FolD [Gemmatales bacterium]